MVRDGVLLFVTLGFSLTGYLLPWDQKGYWATKVATNIMGMTPVVGPYVQKVVLGGSDYGNQTLTRFYGLHVGVLPALMVMCVAAHVALFRRHGLTSRKAASTGTWPSAAGRPRSSGKATTPRSRATSRIVRCTRRSAGWATR